MADNQQLQNIHAKLARVLKKEAAWNTLSEVEALQIIASLLAPVCGSIANKCHSKETFDNAQVQVNTIVSQYIQPLFANKRVELISQGAYAPTPPMRDELMGQIDKVLSQGPLKIEDTLHIVGQLVIRLTIILGEVDAPITEASLIDRQKLILGSLQNQVQNGLDMVRLKHGLVRRH